MRRDGPHRAPVPPVIIMLLFTVKVIQDDDFNELGFVCRQHNFWFNTFIVEDHFLHTRSASPNYTHVGQLTQHALEGGDNFVQGPTEVRHKT